MFYEIKFAFQYVYNNQQCMVNNSPEMHILLYLRMHHAFKVYSFNASMNAFKVYSFNASMHSRFIPSLHPCIQGLFLKWSCIQGLFLECIHAFKVYSFNSSCIQFYSFNASMHSRFQCILCIQVYALMHSRFIPSMQPCIQSSFL